MERARRPSSGACGHVGRLRYGPGAALPASWVGSPARAAESVSRAQDAAGAAAGAVRRPRLPGRWASATPATAMPIWAHMDVVALPAVRPLATEP
ncbi:MAG: hypothetical protein NZ525_10175 [Rhodothermia bacterium]|nr:hypothetical protein [Rhodothermia bacterium]